MTAPLLRVEGLTQHFPVTRGVFGRVVGQVRAVDDVSFDIAPGETLGLVGESGCGKTTVGRAVLRLIEPTAGKVTFDGVDVTAASPKVLTRLRRHLQIVFQDPFGSLNPRMRVLDIVGEALSVHGIAQGEEMERRVKDILTRVGLSPAWMNRYPHEFSGGQRQRIGIARAIALEPKLIVCDEAVSALDVSVQAQVINLLIRLRREMGLSYLFIAHDLSVVRHVSDRIAVMYLGQIVELGPTRRIFETPAHPYTRALLSAIPVPAPGRKVRRLVLQGDVPSPQDPPSGCRFHTRCPAVIERCRTEDPPTVTLAEGHVVKCLHAEGLAGAPRAAEQVGERVLEQMAANAAREAAREKEGGSPVVEAPDFWARTGPGAAVAESAEGWTLAGAVMAAVGALLAVFGSWAVGALVGSGAYLLLLRRRVRPRYRGDLVCVAALVACLVAGRAVARHRAHRAAETDLARLSTELTQYTKTTGAAPRTLGELGWRLYTVFDQGSPVDPWGRPIRYRSPGERGRAFDVWSTGEDGVASDDDLRGPVEGAR